MKKTIALAAELGLARYQKLDGSANNINSHIPSNSIKSLARLDKRLKSLNNHLQPTPRSLWQSSHKLEPSLSSIRRRLRTLIGK